MSDVIITHASHDGTGAYMPICHDSIVCISAATAEPGFSSQKEILGCLEKGIPPGYPPFLFHNPNPVFYKVPDPGIIRKIQPPAKILDTGISGKIGIDLPMD
jgi:hypothetical protein